MAQVRLVDDGSGLPRFSEAENRRLFRQISQWHLTDCEVVDQRDFTVRAIIELDDRSQSAPGTSFSGMRSAQSGCHSGRYSVAPARSINRWTDRRQYYSSYLIFIF